MDGSGRVDRLTNDPLTIFREDFIQLTVGVRPPRTKTAVCGPSTRPFVHVDNGPKFRLGPSISLTNSDVGPRLSFEGGRMDQFLPWTVHLMDEFGRWTKKIILRWTIWRIFDSMDGFGRQMINISIRWMEVDEWTGRRMKQTGRWTGDPLTIFPGDYIQLTVEV